MLDVLIIGGGVVGCAVARELSRYALKIAVLEKEEDVGAGTSKANSAIIHAGFDAETGTLKARFNVAGCEMMGRLAQELDIPFKRNGSLVVALSEEDIPKLEALKQRGDANGVPDLRIISGDEARAMEPALSKDIPAALHAPTAGIVCPFEMTQAFAENACVNGVEFFLNTAVRKISPAGNSWTAETDKGNFEAKVIVNCAGLYSDVLHNQVCEDQLRIVPRRGEYQLLDHKAGNLVSATIFQAPGKLGKGVLVTPTAHGNLMIGPTAEDIDDREATCTTAEGLSKAAETAKLSVPGVPFRQVITSFSGLRAHLDGDHHDFCIGNPVPGYFEAAGVESPGLTAAPAIGAYLAGEIAAQLGADEKRNFNPIRRVIRPREMDFEARQALVKENPAYGAIVCRCEQVSEGEILDAIRRPLGARSLDAVKRRTRAGMGRCQAGFCSARVMELLRRELGEDFAVTKCGAGSEMEGGEQAAEA
ncbi:MAG: NAD(P)/FAD-dependent oxidoreductase [Clostridia bacterium]|nr:NAD(P)/FAD-dependent oxidoreductase [Clostridia bacterium]